MGSVRINVSLPEETFPELTREMGNWQRNRVITQAVKRLLDEKKVEQLAAEYAEAAAEIKRINHELEGTISDGLD